MVQRVSVGTGSSEPATPPAQARRGPGRPKRRKNNPKFDKDGKLIPLKERVPPDEAYHELGVKIKYKRQPRQKKASPPAGSHLANQGRRRVAPSAPMPAAAPSAQLNVWEFGNPTPPANFSPFRNYGAELGPWVDPSLGLESFVSPLPQPVGWQPQPSVPYYRTEPMSEADFVSLMGATAQAPLPPLPPLYWEGQFAPAPEQGILDVPFTLAQQPFFEAVDFEQLAAGNWDQHLG
ncbi:hypothetical protein NX059_002796 [Plenodomus lindquistii]|nr:hypothetical protein NX059_002796 [Plenodomus lindquistii]